MSRLLRRQVALPSDHGSWGFLLSPLLIGLFAGGRWTTVSLYLVLAALSAFLIRQPITTIIKIYSERRSRDDLDAAIFWTIVYGGIGLLHVAALVARGFGHLLYLAIPGLPVFAWHLYLVSRRTERRQLMVQLVGAGTLALSAPAAMWVGLGRPEPIGWLLWLLTWAQSAAAILHAYLGLRQRTMKSAPAIGVRLRMGRRALVLTSCSLLGALGFCVSGAVPRWLFVPYALQWTETLRATLRPAIGAKPQAIGYRQLAVSALFTVLFILAWR